MPETLTTVTVDELIAELECCARGVEIRAGIIGNEVELSVDGVPLGYLDA